jgi:hypothetical protein
LEVKIVQWLRIYIDRTLFGTTFNELNAEERGVWFSLLVLSGYSPIHGKLGITETIPYSKAQLSALLKLSEEVIERSIGKLLEVGKVTVDENSVITIVNWSKYQTEYARQASYKEIREAKENAKKEQLAKREQEYKSLDSGVEILSGKTTSLEDEIKVQLLEETVSEGGVELSKVALRKVEEKTGEKWGRPFKRRKKPEMQEILASFPDAVDDAELKEPEPKASVEKELIKETDEPFNADDLIRADENAGNETGSEVEQVMSPEYKTHLFIKAYCDAYKGKYKSFPEITKKTQGIAARLVEELGLTKCQDYIKSYLSMEDAWFKTRGHDLPTFESSLNKVKVQFEQSKTKVTSMKIKTQEEIDREDKVRSDNRARMAQIMRDNPIGKVIP